MMRWLSRLLATAPLAGLAACSALSQQADKTQYFVLTPEVGPAESARVEPTIGIGPVTIPDHLDDRIVTRLSAEEVAISDHERWAEPLRDSLVAILRQEIGADLGTARIVAYPWRPSEAPDLAIAVELVHFERTTRGTVEVAARWTIGNGPGASPVVARSATIRRAFAGTDTRAAVAALSAGVAELSRQIAADVARVPVAYDGRTRRGREGKRWSRDSR
jgi:uncharacterized lipoprotein YmbA